MHLSSFKMHQNSYKLVAQWIDDQHCRMRNPIGLCCFFWRWKIWSHVITSCPLGGFHPEKTGKGLWCQCWIMFDCSLAAQDTTMNSIFLLKNDVFFKKQGEMISVDFPGVWMRSQDPKKKHALEWAVHHPPKLQEKRKEEVLWDPLADLGPRKKQQLCKRKDVGSSQDQSRWFVYVFQYVE